jgi:hypothetical protein
VQHFRIRGDNGARQVRQVAQHGLALTEVAQSEFSDDEGMRQNHSGVEQANE